jgi:hypothetical protein
MVSVFKDHVFKVGPRTGLSTRLNPHKYQDGSYKIFSPEGVIGTDGKLHYNRLENSKSVKTIAEVAAHVKNDWGVRMSGPLMISPSIFWIDIKVLP